MQKPSKEQLFKRTAKRYLNTAFYVLGVHYALPTK